MPVLMRREESATEGGNLGMETPFKSIQTIQSLLNEVGIPSVVIGGVAVGAWGEPRVTRDVDLKVLVSRDEADRLLALLTPHYEPLVGNPQDVLKKQGMLFVQDPLGTRLDLLLADTPYDAVAVERGREVDLQPGVTIRVCSPEDLIIYKLISTRPRDYEDVRGVIRRQGDHLDDSYVVNWLRQFETALDDSTLVQEYRQLRERYRG